MSFCPSFFKRSFSLCFSKFTKLCLCRCVCMCVNVSDLTFYNVNSYIPAGCQLPLNFSSDKLFRSFRRYEARVSRFAFCQINLSRPLLFSVFDIFIGLLFPKKKVIFALCLWEFSGVCMTRFVFVYKFVNEFVCL